MSRNLLILALFLHHALTCAQELPGFLANSRFNPAGTGSLVNHQVDSIVLPADHPDRLRFASIDRFRFPAGRQVVTWGRGMESPGVFFREDLPSIFTRCLRFDNFAFESGLFEWVFTGDKAGFSLAISRDTLWLYQRYYDSYGFNEPGRDRISIKRHPETIWLLHAMPYEGKIESVTVSISHKMILSLRVNGVLVSEQSCLFDVTEHQLRFTGKDPSIRGELTKPDGEEAGIDIRWGEKRQTMLGWGGIASPMAFQLLSEEGKARWWDYLLEYNLLLHREYPNGQNLAADFSNWDLPGDATPHYYGDNFPNGEISDFRYIKKVQELGGSTLFEFWKFPPWVQEKDQPDIDAYCEAMVNYCQTAQRKTGKPPAIVGIQNEVRQTRENWHGMTLALRKALDENGFSQVRIHQQDMGRIVDGMQSARVFRENDEVWETIDYAATHMYDYQLHFFDPDGYDSLITAFKAVTGNKPFLSTELCVNNPAFQAGSYRIAFAMAQLYHKNLTLLDASAILYCWVLLNTVQPSYEASRSLFGVDKMNGSVPRPSSYQLRTYGAWSRRIKKGMWRVEAMSPHPDLLVTAFSGKEGETVVLVNRSDREIKCTVPAGRGPYHYLERSSQYHPNRVEILKERRDGQMGISIWPGEIITLSSVGLNKE